MGDDEPVADPTRYPILPVDLLAYLPQGITIDDNSVPSKAAVQLMITNVASRIDGFLRSRGFTLPLEPVPWVLDFLNSANTYGALAEWAKVKYPADSGPGGSKGYAESWGTKFEQFLKDIQSGALGLPDEDRSVVASGFERRDREIDRHIFTDIVGGFGG